MEGTDTIIFIRSVCSIPQSDNDENKRLLSSGQIVGMEERIKKRTRSEKEHQQKQAFC